MYILKKMNRERHVYTEAERKALLANGWEDVTPSRAEKAAEPPAGGGGGKSDKEPPADDGGKPDEEPPAGDDGEGNPDEKPRRGGRK